MNEQKQPQGKPLTAEEMISKFSYCPEYCNKEIIGVDDAEKIFTEYTAAIRDELDQLKRWKEEQMAVYASLLDFGQSNESGLRIGESIVSGAISAWKERNELREELEEVKTELQYKSENLTDALRQIEHYENRLEVVKQEKDQWQETYQNEHINLLEVTGQRDECKDILIEIKESAIIHETTDRAITNLLSRISSGETKPVSRWIKVEERLPEIGEAVFVWNESVDIAEYCHDNTGHPRFFYDNESWFHSVELWQPIPLPAPPESSK